MSNKAVQLIPEYLNLSVKKNKKEEIKAQLRLLALNGDELFVNKAPGCLQKAIDAGIESNVYSAAEIAFDPQDTEVTKCYLRLKDCTADDLEKILYTCVSNSAEKNKTAVIDIYYQLLRHLNTQPNSEQSRLERSIRFLSFSLNNRTNEVLDLCIFLDTEKMQTSGFFTETERKKLEENYRTKLIELMDENFSEHAISGFRYLGLELNRTGLRTVKYLGVFETPESYEDVFYKFCGKSISEVLQKTAGIRTLENPSMFQLSYSPSSPESLKLNVYFQPEEYQYPAKYLYNPRFVPRDIDQVYFLIDIKDKDIYRKKNLNQINAAGFKILKYMQKKTIFTIQGAAEYLFREYKAFGNEQLKEQIQKDVFDFSDVLEKQGVIAKVEK